MSALILRLLTTSETQWLRSELASFAIDTASNLSFVAIDLVDIELMGGSVKLAARRSIASNGRHITSCQIRGWAPGLRGAYTNRQDL